jgi:hypothetical protein
VIGMGMGLQRQLARIAAAIVLIAVFALPSLAIAHEGHAHHPSQVAAPLPESTSPDTCAADTRAADIRTHEQHAVLSATPDSSSAPAGVTTRCGGSCCSAGMACCGAALASDAISIPLVQASEQLGIPRAPPLSGLPPEALPKPPKSVA